MATVHPKRGWLYFLVTILLAVITLIVVPGTA